MAVQFSRQKHSRKTITLDPKLRDHECFQVRLVIWRNGEITTGYVEYLLRKLFDDMYIRQAEQLNVDRPQLPTNPWTVRGTALNIQDSIKGLEFIIRFSHCSATNEYLASLVLEALWAELQQLTQLIKQYASRNDAEQDPGLGIQDEAPIDELARRFSTEFIGLSLYHPNPQREFDHSVARCSVTKYNAPPPPDRFLRCKFYHGPLIALERVLAILRNAAPLFERTPVVGGPLGRVLTTARVASSFDTTGTILERFDSGNVGELINVSFPIVARKLEKCLGNLQNVVDRSGVGSANPRDVCLAIHALLELRRNTPALTFALDKLQNAEAQRAALCGTLIGSSALLLFCGLLLTTAPASVPAAVGAAGSAATGTAMGGTVSFTAATATEVAATAGPVSARLLQGLITSGAVGLVTNSPIGLKTWIDLAKTRTVIVINTEIDNDLRGAAYYLALCFMTSSGISSPQDSHMLKDVLGDLDAVEPQYAQRNYVPAYLKQLIIDIWVGFQKVQKLLKDKGHRQPRWLGFQPQGLTAAQRALEVR